MGREGRKCEREEGREDRGGEEKGGKGSSCGQKKSRKRKFDKFLNFGASVSTFFAHQNQVLLYTMHTNALS